MKNIRRFMLFEIKQKSARACNEDFSYRKNYTKETWTREKLL